MLNARVATLPLDVDRGITIKTPGRTLVKPRNVLQENAVRNVPMTILGKGKKVQNTPLQSKTLQTDRVLTVLPGKQVGPSKSKDTPAIRPLGDKTPFPNRTTSFQLATAGAKVTKPALIDGSLRPSSSRKCDRLPRSASKVFETPVTNGKHWDVSDIEIEVGASVANELVEEETFDEIEYMPPKVQDIPYEPPFEMPNYREVGKTLMALIRTYTLDDDQPSTEVTFTPDASESNFFAQPILPLREIEDDSPFARAKPGKDIKSQTSTSLKQRSAVTNKSSPPSAGQRITRGTRAILPGKSHVSPAVERSHISQPITRASTSQSTIRAAPSKAANRAPSAARSTPPARAGVAEPSRAPCISRPASTTKYAARLAAPTVPPKVNTITANPIAGATSIPRNVTSPSDSLPNARRRPRSGTITKAAFESNAHEHMVVRIRSNSLEDVKKDLEGLVVFEDAFDDDDGFRFDV